MQEQKNNNLSQASSREATPDDLANLNVNNNQVRQKPKEVRQRTTGDGNCAFHAMFGRLNHAGEYHCDDAPERRNILSNRVEEAKRDSDLWSLVVASICELVMSERSIAATSPQLSSLRVVYQKSLNDPTQSALPLWSQFENILKQYPEVLSYINIHHRDCEGQAASLQRKFQDALNRNNGQLRDLIRSEPALNRAYEEYNKLSTAEFKWDTYISGDVLKEYADFIRSGEWLLASEVALVAAIFGITVNYYAHPDAVNSEILNPDQTQTVTIGFNGSHTGGHYERMIPSLVESTTNKNHALDVEQPASTLKTAIPSTTSGISNNASLSNIEPQKSTSPTNQTSNAASRIDTSYSSHSVRYPYLQNALKVAYREKDSLPMPLAEGLFPIQAVSLTINVKEKQQEHDKKLTQDKEQDKQTGKDSKNYNSGSQKKPIARSEEFGQNQLEREAAWHKVEKPVPVANMFTRIAPKENKEKSAQPEQVRRVLVEGRAGVGKTTLVQFIAWQWATQGLFSDKYDYVLWIPLRQWLNSQSKTIVKTSFKEDLAAFVFEQHLAHETTTEHLDELEAILDKHSDRTLLILDGYDEVAHYLDEVDSIGQPTLHGQLLAQALKFKNLLITTRDYQLPPASILFDQTLVNIGFIDSQIEQYLTQYQAWLKGPSNLQLLSTQPSRHSSASTDLPLRTALRDNTQLWALAHIPLNLALLCQTYGNLTPDKTKTAALDEISLTQLYQKVLENFLVRQGKKEGRNLPKFYDLNTLKEKFVVEWNVLSILAWIGFQQGQIVLSPNMQAEVFRELKLRTYPQLSNFEIYFSHALDLGLMRSQNPNDPTGRDQPRYFIHLTFQEYFAAQYLADSLQGYWGEEAYQKALDWIKQNKYDPHGAVVIGFIAGITAEKGYYDHAFSAFWHVLLSPPYELIQKNLKHIGMTLRCLTEANCDMRIPGHKQLMAEIDQWAKQCRWDTFWTLMVGASSKVWQHAIIPSSLRALKDEDKKVRKASIDILGNLKEKLVNFPQAISALLQVIKDENYEIRCSVISILGQLGEKLENFPEILSAFLQALEDKNMDVRGKAIYFLVNLGERLWRFPQIVSALTGVILNGNSRSHYEMYKAAEILDKLGEKLENFPEIVPTLVQMALRGKNSYLLEKLGKQLGNFPKTISDLIQAVLNDEDGNVRFIAVEILGKLDKLSNFPEVVTVLLRALEDEYWYVRFEAVKVLGKLDKLSNFPEVVTVLLQASEDEYWDVRFTVIRVLIELKELNNFPEIIAVLLQALRNQDIHVQEEALSFSVIQQLNEQLWNFPEITLAVVLIALEGEKSDTHFYTRKFLRILVSGHHNYLDRNFHEIAVHVLDNMVKKLPIFPNDLQVSVQAALENTDYGAQGFTEVLDEMVEELASYPDVFTALVQTLQDQANEFLAQATLENQIEDGPEAAVNSLDMLPVYDHQLLSLGKQQLPERKSNVFVWQPSYQTKNLVQNDELIWLAKAIQNYLTESSVSTKETCLQAILQKLKFQFVIGITIDSQQLTLWSQNREQIISFASPDQIKPLVDALVQAHEIKRLPSPDYAACMGVKALYPEAAQQPSFKTAKFPAPEPLSAGTQTGSYATSKALATNNKKSRNQQLRRRLRTVPPITRVFISYAWETKGSQQLEFLQNRFLHNTLVTDLRIAGLSPWLDVREMVGDMDKQMRENIAQSRFVIMIGTKLYAERSQLLECQLLRLSSFQDSDDLQALSFTANTAYIRAENQLFYVGDKAKKQVVWLKHITQQALQDFDRVTQLDTLPQGQVRTLSKATLSQITLATCHSHTNVRKEVEFILDRAKHPETPKDFLLPLLLEGEFNKMSGEINEVNQKFLLHCHEWVSIPEARWKSYKAYILALTQTLPLGILPALLGFSGLTDKVRSDYQVYADALKLKLEDLERTHVITASTDMEARLQADLYFERQRNLLHEFLRQVAALTRPFGQVPVVPGQPSNDNNLLLPNKTPSNNADKQPTLPCPAFQLPTNQPHHPSSPSVGRYAFFPSQKPAAIQETQVFKEKQTAMQEKLRELVENNEYKFSLERIESSRKQDRQFGASADHALVIKFTAFDMIHLPKTELETIRDNLGVLKQALQTFIQASISGFKPKWLQADWNNRTLTIYANANDDIDRIAQLLQIIGKDEEAGINYIQQEQDQFVTCVFQ